MNIEWSVSSESEEDTISLGHTVGAALSPGDVVLISGELGTGKTRFVQGIAEGLGTADRPRSPTFVLVNRHPGRLTLHHCDLYRLDSSGEVEDLGLTERIEDGDVLAVEWPERARRLFPDDSLEVAIEIGNADTDRKINLRATGPNSSTVLRNIQSTLNSEKAVG